MESDVTFSDEAEEAYDNLKGKSKNSKVEGSILRAIDQKIVWIKLDTNYGNPIAKNLIPNEYIIKYEAKNLFRIELPDYWRMLYTLRPPVNGKVIAFVLDILDHKNYSKKFGYK